MSEGRSAPSVEEGIALSHPSSLKPERERENIETCLRDKASKSGKVCSLSEMYVCRVGALPGVGGFREGHGVEVGPQCAAFSSLEGQGNGLRPHLFPEDRP